jgi:hypothetical protein
MYLSYGIPLHHRSPRDPQAHAIALTYQLGPNACMDNKKRQVSDDINQLISIFRAKPRGNEGDGSIFLPPFAPSRAILAPIGMLKVTSLNWYREPSYVFEMDSAHNARSPAAAAAIENLRIFLVTCLHCFPDRLSKGLAPNHGRTSIPGYTPKQMLDSIVIFPWTNPKLFNNAQNLTEISHEPNLFCHLLENQDTLLKLMRCGQALLFTNASPQWFHTALHR